jgi:carboxymethylenebutenolidase
MTAQPIKDMTRDGLHARVAVPDGKSRFGVLLIPSAAGLNPFVDKVLAQLADEGFTALAWNPFTAYPDLPPKERSRISETVLQDTDALREQGRWVDCLAGEMGAESIASIGFCMGGRMSLLLAAGDARIRAAVAYYPTMRDPRPANAVDPVGPAARIACPVQVHYPGLDHLTSRASFHRLRDALEARPAPAPSFMQVYPKAHHGFQSKTAEEDKDDAAAGAIAWPATLAFLHSATKQAF